VSPERVENILIRSPLIAQAFVYGDSFQSCLVAIIVPDEERVLAWAQTKDNTQLSFADLCKMDTLRKDLMADIARLSKENGLHGFETVKAVYVEPNQFTPENDLLTPSFKLKRHTARDYYEKEIADMYASLSLPKSKL
jgi:long-chain acyl-CoA synthetase